MTRHVCMTAWLYVAVSVLAVAVSLASDGTPPAISGQVDTVTGLVMQGTLGGFALAELARWRDLGAQFLKLLDSALEDLREGRMSRGRGPA